MRARSLKAWAELPANEDLALGVEIFQALESVSPVYRFGVQLYNWIQLKAPWAHHLYFHFLELAGLHKSASRMAPQARQRFQEKIIAASPDLVVSTHAHLNHGFFELVRQTRPGCPCVTYCGEVFGGYGFAQGWASPQADAFFAATEACRRQALEMGVAESRVHQAGFLLNPVFWEPEPSLMELRAFLCTHAGLPGERPLVILATGANSANNHLRLLESLSRQRISVEVIALCGNNHEARARLSAWASSQKTISVAALPRQNSASMRRYLLLASAIVARPGTGTTSEAILCGTPIIHNGLGGIMPQEWLTVKYLRMHGADRVISRPGQLPTQLAPLLAGPDALHRAREQMRQLRPEGHPRAILERLAALESGTFWLR